MQMNCDKPLPIGVGSRFAIREGGQTIGRAIVTKLLSAKEAGVEED